MAKHKDKNKGNSGGGQGKNQSASDQYPVGKGALGKTPGAFKPDTLKQIIHQAKKTVRSAYKPGYVDLKDQGKEIQAISDKRELDNQQYLDWLAARTDQINSHAASAAATVNNNQALMQQQAEQKLGAMRDQLIQEGGSHAGVVSQGAEATAFDTTPEATSTLGTLLNERDFTDNLVKDAGEARDSTQQSNFAYITNLRNKNLGETDQKLDDLRDQRRTLRLTQAGDQEQETARLLTQEIDKAKANVDFKNMSASQALALMAQNLEQKKYRFDVRSTFRGEQNDKRAELANEKNDRRGTSEDIRHDKAQEALDAKGLILDQQQQAAETGKEAAQRSQEITTNIQNGITYIKTDPSLKNLGVKELIHNLTKHGMDASLAQAAAELATKGHLSNSTTNSLQTIGYDIPKQYK